MTGYKFLLIGEAPAEGQWSSVLESALTPIGVLDWTTVKGIEGDLEGDVAGGYALTILDARLLDDPVQTVNKLLRRDPFALLVVATASPTWEGARSVLRAGAADYIAKSWDSQQLRSELQAVLERGRAIKNGSR